MKLYVLRLLNHPVGESNDKLQWKCSILAMYNNKGNNKITELRTILQRESQNSGVYKQTK
jgi:hypothetical protein